MEDINEALSELIRLGLIEVVGIKDNGEWLYAATPRGASFVNDAENLLLPLEAIQDFLNNGKEE